MRAKQVVVVGDSKQLPPTRFFARILENEEEEGEQEQAPTADLESVLGLLCAQGARQRMLRWHYRSRHQSLIAVSNLEFYDNKLILYPSPSASRSPDGLIFRHLPHTVYEQGATKRRNVEEAREVARAVMDHARNSAELSLGVAAFSHSQARTIEDEVEALRRSDPSLEVYFTGHPEEPFFVKNLENVQGDERDVVFISVGYGKREGGYMSMGFGPLNWDGGERRLNVLITRARRRCVVFANFTSDDIDLARSQARGVVALKRYLKYAQTGIDEISAVSGKEADSPFEDQVADELSSLGLVVHRQVGSAGFFIDLAIVDSSAPGRYLLGIECDGATYHSARSARDRDRLRQEILENLGWSIHRIWSSDWFRNRDKEIRRLREAIEKAGLSQPNVTARSKPEPEVEHQPSGDERVDQQAGAKPYCLAQITVQLTRWEELHSVGSRRLADWICEVVRVESPVHMSEAARRITNAAGLRRVGNRILSAVQRAAKLAERNGRIRIEAGFLFDTSTNEIAVRDRSELPPSAKKIECVAPIEMAAAIVLVVERSCGIEREEAVTSAARMLGFQRTGTGVESTIDSVWESMLKKGILKLEGKFVVLA